MVSDWLTFLIFLCGFLLNAKNKTQLIRGVLWDTSVAVGYKTYNSYKVPTSVYCKTVM